MTVKKVRSLRGVHLMYNVLPISLTHWFSSMHVTAFKRWEYRMFILREDDCKHGIQKVDIGS